MSPIYKVFRVDDSLRVKQTELLEDGRRLIDHCDLRVPITVEGNKVTVHVGEAEGKLEEGHIFGFDSSMEISERGFITDISMTLPPTKSAMVIYDFNFERNAPTLYIERHDRRTKNFPHSGSKEKK